MKLGIILGDQLFSNKVKADHYFMAESYELCKHYNYHKHKIVLFLSAMRSYASKNENITYSKLTDKSKYIEKLEKICKQKKVTQLVMYEIEDKFFEKEIRSFSRKHKIQLIIEASPGFLTNREQFLKFLDGRKKVLFNEFYIWQRKRLNILMENDKPIGGQWSFDKDNRKKIPKNLKLAKIDCLKKNQTTMEVCNLVEEWFTKHPGDTNNFYLPTTRSQALKWLDNFLEERFKEFGTYEDAILKEDNFLFHSVLSPLINIGLITPKEILEKVEKYDAPLNSKEGFIRQLIGWREFVRGVYHNWDFEKNYFNHKNKLSKSWYEATTGIEPLDDAIKKVKQFAYTHHIQRLMIIGNVMLLSEIDPKQVNKWFMEMFCDSADWVMAPNVYGMSQFADGGSFATKPYICGSNYILKMSNYKKGEWCEILDGLYWRFISKNKKLFLSNARMPFVVKSLESMDKDRKKRIFKKAEEFIKNNTK